jgi:hypothetical protein
MWIVTNIDKEKGRQAVRDRPYAFDACNTVAFYHRLFSARLMQPSS